MEVSFLPTLKTADDADYDLWEDIESSVKITIEPNSDVRSYRFMGDDLERNASGMCKV